MAIDDRTPIEDRTPQDRTSQDLAARQDPAARHSDVPAPETAGRHSRAEDSVGGHRTDTAVVPAVATPVAGARATRGSAVDAIAAQQARFGGIRWGAAFFGWLSANGLAVILVALVSAGGVGIGLANGVDTTHEAANRARTVGLAGAIALLVVLFLAYLAGGYVAGRMARFDGPRQGLAVWLIGLVVVLVLAAAGWIVGAQYNVLKNLNLPRVPIDEGTATTAGVITLAAVLVATLVGAVLGGALGTRFHRRIDRAALDA